MFKTKFCIIALILTVLLSPIGLGFLNYPGWILVKKPVENKTLLLPCARPLILRTGLPGFLDALKEGKHGWPFSLYYTSDNKIGALNTFTVIGDDPCEKYTSINILGLALDFLIFLGFVNLITLVNLKRLKSTSG